MRFVLFHVTYIPLRIVSTFETNGLCVKCFGINFTSNGDERKPINVVNFVVDKRILIYWYPIENF